MSDGYVYAIACGDKVKIGWSVRPWQRFLEVQTHNPNECELLGAKEGCEQDEVDAHQKLAQWRVRGEWFELSPEVEAFIATFPECERPRGPGKPGLQAYIRRSGITQAEFAAKVGLTQGRISQIINSGTHHLGTATKIEAATDGEVSLIELLPDDLRADFEARA